ncbi:glycosyltransferase [Demequina capsici]|uniref:Glycosyltransferase n=1 Tax=Demequina capsici TaxID=3075620 RepID=A0AA96J908_9MICO|nr:MULTISPECIES: glycosyltransferase [unclassified Demequina]WNM25513.1 glycosyltransferase [Demequina sp. OYTSA14]WNM28404.1 glycosyltransferase [Demequina sp. PMTSA13]
MRGVLVHEWLARAGGSENVFEAMSRIYPDEDMLCLWDDSDGRFEASRLRETWLARTPLRRSKALALPLMPLAWRTQRGPDYDWALISSHAFAHHVDFGRPDMPRFVYVHTPARYVWTPELDGRGSNLAVRAVAATLKGTDRRRALAGARLAANSAFVQERIARTWGVPARVIHPPVDVERIQSRDWAPTLDDDEARILDGLPDQFMLGASRFIPYKELDTVIRAGEACDMPVVLAGRGPELPRLQALADQATVPVTFVISPSNALLWALFRRAAVYVFPAVEDFGIMPVEAMAAGAPVVARDVGGTTESVVDGVTGALCGFESPASVKAAVERATATSLEDRLAHAQRFSQARFATEIREWVGA